MIDDGYVGGAGPDGEKARREPLSAKQLAAVCGGMRLFRGIGARDIAKALRVLSVREAEFEKEATLFSAGERLDAFFCLLEGRIHGVRYKHDGTMDLVQNFSPGELVGLDVAASATRICPFWLIADEDCHGLFFGMDSLFSQELPHAIRSVFSANVMHLLANDSIRRLHKIDVLSQRTLRGRIAVYLRHMSIMKGSSQFHIDMTRDQMARYLGVNRTALSHTLALMREEGLIDFRLDFFFVKSDDLRGD